MIGHQKDAAVVLLVDDDEAKRYLMGTWLRRGGHTVVEAGTGKEALEKAGSAELILLDVNLPDISGSEVLRRLRSDARTADIPVVVVSADATQDRVRHLLASGAAAYLTKPIDVVRLMGVIEETMRERRLDHAG